MTEADQWNSETRIAKLGMNDKAVGTGLALPNKGAASSAPTNSLSEIWRRHLNRTLMMYIDSFGGTHGIVGRES